MIRKSISFRLILAGIPFLLCLHGHAQITPGQAILQMQRGINLGNTLEPPLEGGWNNPMAEEYYFDMYRDAGFQTVRIPVRWDRHTATTSPYTIDTGWLNRVEQVVDWGLERGLWIVVNAHHDNWIKEHYELQSNRDRFDSIWVQVARRFAGKPEKLVFEILNEPHGLTREQNDEMHARVLSIIRESNPTRLVIFQGHNWGGSDELITAAIPGDDYLIGSFHSYDPYTFGLLGRGKWGTAWDIAVIREKFAGVKAWSDTHGIPVFLGEFGAIRYTVDESGKRTGEQADFNSRMKHYQTYVEQSIQNGFAFCAWDDGGDFRILEREEKRWKVEKDILIHGDPASPGYPSAVLYRDTIIRLTWSLRESGCDRFIIQRAVGNGAFSTVDTVPADSSVYHDEGLAQQNYYTYRVIADFDTLAGLYSCPVRVFLPEYVPKVRSPFHGEPLPIPGTIEAEDFDNGGEGLSYHDSDPSNIAGAYRPDEGVDIYDRLGEGFHIGNAMPGEWYEYSVEVEKSDTFRMTVHTAAPVAGGTFRVTVGRRESPLLAAPVSYSWLDTDTVSCLMPLDSGIQIMRFSVISDPLFNIDKIEFTQPGEPSGDTAVSAWSLPEPAGPEIGRDADGNLWIRTTGTTRLHSVSVYSLSGALLFRDDDPAGELLVDRSLLSPGLCILHARYGETQIRKKILIHP